MTAKVSRMVYMVMEKRNESVKENEEAYTCVKWRRHQVGVVVLDARERRDGVQPIENLDEGHQMWWRHERGDDARRGVVVRPEGNDGWTGRVERDGQGRRLPWVTGDMAMGERLRD